MLNLKLLSSCHRNLEYFMNIPFFIVPSTQDLCDCLTNTENNGITASVRWVAEHYKSGTPITLLNRPIPKLTDANSWQVWKDRLLHYYDNEATRDAAIYVYCVVKDF